MSPSPYRQKLNWLVLLGLVCTGFTYEQDRPFAPLLYAAAGLVALRLRRLNLSRRAWLEGVLLFIAIVLAYMIGTRFGPNRLVFVANALVIHQLFRLLWAPTVRQQKFAVAVTLMQLAVGSMVIVEPERFLVVLALAVFLVPGEARGRYRLRPPWPPPAVRTAVPCASLLA